MVDLGGAGAWSAGCFGKGITKYQQAADDGRETTRCCESSEQDDEKGTGG
jgi:hypothetical protein